MQQRKKMSMPLPPGFGPQDIGTEESPSKSAKPVAQRGLTEAETLLIMRKHLKPQHREDPHILRFIEEYLMNPNPEEAAKAAGLTKASGEALRRRPDIHETICQLRARAVMKFGYDAEEIVQKVKEIVNIDIATFQDPATGLGVENLNDLPGPMRRAVKKFKIKNVYDTDANGMRVYAGKLIEVELWDKMKAIELLGREKDLFKETKRVEHDVTANMQDVLLASKRRADERVKELNAPRDVTESAMPLPEGE
jgi:hypothetical protein